MKDIEEMLEKAYEMFEGDMETARIYADKRGIEIKGYTPTILTIFSNIVVSMKDLNGVNDDMIRRAFELGMKKDDEDAMKEEFVESLKKLKSALEEIMEEEKKDE